jgi:hypothetical protein
MSSLIEITKKDKDFEHKAATLVNKLFLKIQAIMPAYKQAWADQEVLNEAKRQWLKALIKYDVLTSEKIDTGIENLIDLGSRFPPAVGEFIALCVPKPAKLGVPTHAVAYNEAVRRSYPGGSGEKWSHAVVYHAWFETGSRALNMATGSYQIKEMKDLFYANYDITLKMFAEGGKLRELPKLLNKPDFISVVTKEGTECLNNLKKMAQG